MVGFHVRDNGRRRRTEEEEDTYGRGTRFRLFRARRLTVTGTLVVPRSFLPSLGLARCFSAAHDPSFPLAPPFHFRTVVLSVHAVSSNDDGGSPSPALDRERPLQTPNLAERYRTFPTVSPSVTRNFTRHFFNPSVRRLFPRKSSNSVVPCCFHQFSTHTLIISHSRTSSSLDRYPSLTRATSSNLVVDASRSEIT